MKKWLHGETFKVRSEKTTTPHIGRPRRIFKTEEKEEEEERDFLKAQVDYLKKRYPHLTKDKPRVSEIIMK